MNSAFIKKTWGVGGMRIIFKELKGYSPRRNVWYKSPDTVIKING